MILLKQIWQKLSFKDKLFLLVVVVLLMYIVYQSFRIAYKDHLLIKRVSEDIETVTQQQELITKRTDSLITKGKITNAKGKTTKQNLNKKLSDEKKIIDNTDYPVSKLDSLLSSYGN